MTKEEEQREVTEEYLQYFVQTIRNGGKVVFVQENNLLSVADANGNWIVLQIKDKVTTKGEANGQDSDTSG
jgi:hypothetical protein